MKLLWLPEARGDIQRLFDFLVERHSMAAAKAIRCIREGAKQLLAHPEVGRPMQDELQRRELFIPFGVGAYVLRYRIHADQVIVLRVWHSREER